jgi:HPt (histidine-containing phosphotransfer) domain-containing protein
MIRARERKTGGHVPIIAMTACALQGDREECLAVGMDGYLTKPIRASRLLKTMEDVLQQMRQGEAPSATCFAEGDVMDWAKALEVVQGDRALLKDMIDAFLEEYPRMLDDIRLSIATSDRAVLQRAAHTVKGSMRYFGAHVAFDRAYELECMGREGIFDGAPQQLQRLETELLRLKPALLAFSQTGQFKSVEGQGRVEGLGSRVEGQKVES